MPIAAFFLVLAGAATIFVLYPHLRIVAGGVVVVFVGLLSYLVFGPEGEVSQSGARIAIDELALTDVEIVDDGRYTSLDGRVTNGSAAFRLRDFNVSVTLRDCPTADSAPEDCAIIAEERGIARVDVPPGQTRPFHAVIAFRNTIPLQGIPVWEHTITSVRATN